MNIRKLMELTIDARVIAVRYNKGSEEAKHELKGFRRALETLGIAMNTYSVDGQISRVELAYGEYVEGELIEID